VTGPEYAIRDIHGWFGLSYANFLVLPRSLLQSMPDEWQERFVSCLHELDEAFDGAADYDPPAGYRVQPVDSGNRLVPWSSCRVPHYNRGRTRVRPA